MKQYAIEFTTGNERHAAIGRERDHLPVYRMFPSGRLERTRLYFPACLKFMYNADIHSEQVNYLSGATIRRRYPVLAPGAVDRSASPPRSWRKRRVSPPRYT